MEYYLIRFTYDHYCQGYEDAMETILVQAVTYTDALFKIQSSKKYLNCRDFVNLTIR